MRQKPCISETNFPLNKLIMYATFASRSAVCSISCDKIFKGACEFYNWLLAVSLDYLFCRKYYYCYYSGICGQISVANCVINLQEIWMTVKPYKKQMPQHIVWEIHFQLGTQCYCHYQTYCILLNRFIQLVRSIT